MNDLETLKDCYEKNLKIEYFCELKENPPIAGQYAKRLLNNCKRALKIYEKYETDYDFQMKECIEDMEDELARRGKIGIISYNLHARILLHVSISALEDGYWELK